MLAFVIMLMAASVPEREPTCKVAAAWARANRNRLPTEYREFTRLALVYRKAAYHELTVAQRKALWQAHLSQWIRPESRLTPAELELVKEVVSGLDEYLDPARGKAAVARTGIEARAKARFGASRGRAIFAMLGPDPKIVPVKPNRAAILFGLDEAILAGLKAIGMVKQNPPPNCYCATTDDWCGGDNHCGGGGCNTSSDGCGFLWLSPCDGLCYPNRS